MKKTLIFVHPHYTIMGGAGRFILELGKRLSKDFKIITISQRVNPSTINDYPEINFITTHGPTTDSFMFWLLFPYWQLKTFLLIKKYIKKNSPIFVSVFPSNWLVFPLRFLFPKNKIYWFCQEPSAFVQDKKWINAINSKTKRGIAILLNPIFKIYDFYLSKIPDTIFANSQFSQKNIFKIYHRDSIIIYPGIDTAVFKPIPFSKKKNYILTVSRLSKFKNIDILIKAFSKINNKNYRLKIVGNGEEISSLKKLCQKLKIKNKVDFLTNVSDSEIISIFQKAKLFVLCSKNEPFGIVPVEAMACGTPVIADNSGGPGETVINGKTGILINNLDVNKLTNFINLLINNEKITHQYSLTCIKQSPTYTWDKSIDRINSLIAL